MLKVAATAAVSSKGLTYLVSTAIANVVHVQVELLQLLALLYKVSNGCGPLFSQAVSNRCSSKERKRHVVQDATRACLLATQQEFLSGLPAVSFLGRGSRRIVQAFTQELVNPIASMPVSPRDEKISCSCVPSEENLCSITRHLLMVNRPLHGYKG